MFLFYLGGCNATILPTGLVADEMSAGRDHRVLGRLIAPAATGLLLRLLPAFAGLETLEERLEVVLFDLCYYVFVVFGIMASN